MTTSLFDRYRPPAILRKLRLGATKKLFAIANGGLVCASSILLPICAIRTHSSFP